MTIVQTSHGKVRGTAQRGVHVFRGVRYGDDTGGSNRFLPPQPPKKWAGIQDATEFSASAPQLAVSLNTDPFYAWYSAIRPISEDCLFLNVFTPGMDGGRRPVMVWIHGGGWREFSGTAPGFDATELARRQDVVVVTLNHRLNAFGFLHLAQSHERFADAGNAGLLDIVAALAWVRDNAGAFGGDPGNVTLFGESGGASKIAAILAMPAAKGLFHKAILGSSGGGLRLCDEGEAARMANELAQAVGHAQPDGEALQAVPMETLLGGLNRVPGPYRGTLDFRNLPADPFHLAAPAVSADVPLMVGYTEVETTYHLRLSPRNLDLGPADVRRRLSTFLDIDDAGVATIIEAYEDAYQDYGPGEILAMVTSDHVFKRTMLRMGALKAAAGGASAYAYMFRRKTPVEGGRLHSPHTCELPFIFGTADVAEAHVGTGSDIEPLTRMMMATWASFARSGDPNNAALPDWAPFREGDQPTMVLDVESELIADPGGAARRTLEVLPYWSYASPLQGFMVD